jgi:uncharacterized heparinase superfamily protein
MADQLRITIAAQPLSDIGFRFWRQGGWELAISAGEIGPAYQPGHAHADTFSFILHFDGRPMLVDTGISTYNKNARRHLERSTSSHNTVTVNGLNSSDVWDGFRVGKRAKVEVFEDSPGKYHARHDGYKTLGAWHSRYFLLSNDGLLIRDTVSGSAQIKRTAYFHIHPECSLEQRQGHFILNNRLRLTFGADAVLSIETYNFAVAYNLLQEAQRIRVDFQDQLETKLSLL